MLTERPHTIAFSRNEIRYVFRLSDLSREGLFLQAQLLYGDIGATPDQTLQTFELKPDADGYIYLYIQAYLDSLLSWAVPDKANAYTNANSQAKTYFILFREITTADPDPNWDITETTYTPRTVIKGGIEKHKNSRNNFFINYFPTKKPFLTWQPSGRFVFPDENIYLTFLNTAISTAGYVATITAVNTAGETVSYDIALPELNALIVHMKADPTTLDIAAHLTGDLYYYQVAIKDGDGITLVNNYTFYIEYRPAYYYYDLIFNNSISGFDFVRVKAPVDESFNREFDEADGGFNLNDWTSKVKAHENEQAGITIRRLYKGDIGYQRTKEEQFALTDILVSTCIYQYIKSRWVPLLALQKSQDHGFNNERIRSFPIEWSLSESNEVYTPEALDFGEGEIIAETPAGGGGGGGGGDCVALSIDGSPVLPDGTVGAAYDYSFTVSGTAPTGVTKNDGPDWLDVSVSGNTVRFQGIPDVAANDIAVNITITNCNGDIPFNDTINIAPVTTLYGCGDTFEVADYAGTGYHDYGYYYLDTDSVPNFMSVNWTANERPNRFTIINETDGVIVATTGWKGVANYIGPWGSSLNTEQSGVMTFAPVAGKIYKVQVETGNAPSLDDSWSVTLTCS